MPYSLWPHGLQHAVFPVHHQHLKLSQTHVHWVGDAMQPSHPISTASPPAFNLSQSQSIGVSASTSVLPINIRNDFFRMNWLDLLAVQGILKSVLQHHNSKPSVLQNSAFFIVQVSHAYMTTGKTIGLTRWTFVGKVMSLLFNMLSRFVRVFFFFKI